MTTVVQENRVQENRVQEGRLQSLTDETVGVGNWILTLIVLAVPLLNVVMLFYWAFSSSTLLSKRNFARASLVLFAIGLGFYLLVLILFGMNGTLTSPN